MKTQIPRATALLAASLLLALVACAPTGEVEPVETAEPPAAEVERYTVRGEIVALPGPGDPKRSIKIHHEAIHNLKSASGAVSGMDAMTMPFAVADDVTLEGVAVADKVEFELELDWSRGEPLEVVAVRPLPPDTELTFGEARPEEVP